MTEFIKRFITGSIIGSVFWCVFFYLPVVAFSLLLFFILSMILLFEWKNLFKLHDFWFWLIMPWYPVLPFGLLIYMNNQACFRNLIYYMFVMVFAFDGTAYLVGTLLGVRKIIPKISPGKTVEGFLGGLVGAFVAFWFALAADKTCLSLSLMTLLVLITCCLAFVGDIFESFLKRQANVKDSGKILPGHGGFLDRFDAVIFATYFFFLFRHALAQFLCQTC